jgi:DNA-binding NtrC family response regulator
MVFGKDFRLLEADSVATAMRNVQEEKPAVVLLDIVMPNADGLEVLKQIKAIHPACEVIMLTASNLQDTAAKAMQFGAFDFIGKPFDVGELRRKVNGALEKALQKTSRRG